MEAILGIAFLAFILWLAWKFDQARARRRLVKEREYEKQQIRRELADQRRRQELLEEIRREEGDRI